MYLSVGMCMSCIPRDAKGIRGLEAIVAGNRELPDMGTEFRCFARAVCAFN